MVAARHRPCRYFAQGQCVHGSFCRFSHEVNGVAVNGANGTVAATTAALGPDPLAAKRLEAVEDISSPTLWPFTGISVQDGLPYAVKGDLSPEELRWEAYREIQHTGACVHYTQRIQALRAEAQRKKELIIDLLWKPKTAKKLFEGGKLTRPSESSNPFASTKGSTTWTTPAYKAAVKANTEAVTMTSAAPIPEPYQPTKKPREGMLKLFCALIGQPSVFPINIEACESVGDVKDAIKEKKRRVVRCDADQIRLFVAKKNGGSWSMTDDAQDEDAKLLKQGKMSRGIQALLMQGELDPTFEIGDYVDEDAPTRRVIHLLVQLPRLLDAKTVEEKKAAAAAQSTSANVPMETVDLSLEDKPAAPLSPTPAAAVPAPISVPSTRVEAASDRVSLPSPAMTRRSKRLKPSGSSKK